MVITSGGCSEEGEINPVKKPRTEELTRQEGKPQKKPGPRNFLQVLMASRY